MDQYIKQSVSARTDFFDKYYTVPPALQQEVAAFIAEINQLAETATDAMDFESKFAASGLSDRFNRLLTGCVPKAYSMTAAEKQHAKETAKEIFKEDRSRILKEAVADAIDHAAVMAEEELIARGREKMIEAEVFDDYTRATNAVDMMTETGSFFKKLFKRGK